MFRTFVVGVLVALTSVSTRSAEACAPPPPAIAGVVVVGAEMPTQARALDAPLILRTKPGDGNWQALPNAPLLTSEGLREPIRTFIQPSAPGTLAFGPVQQLQANTTYRATFEARPIDGEGALDWVFTTGSEQLPELGASGVLQATFNEVAIESRHCGDCGGDCETSLERSIAAQVQLPELHGGAEELGYEVEVVMSAAEPYDFAGTAFSSQGIEKHLITRVEPGGSRDVQVTLPWPDAGFRPCLSFKVADASGKSWVGEPRCFDQQVGGDGEAGCNLGRRGSGGGAALAWALCFGLLLRRARS